jgi:regulator of sigma E protease
MDPTNLIRFILIFAGMVIVHELGHFIAARLCNIEVEEFGIGLPTPGAITLFTWRGTRFTLNWLPLGGFVRPKGENDPNVPGGLAAASPWKRLIVLVAGPLMNLLTAFLIYSFIVSRAGAYEIDKVLVSSVVPSGPAAQAGFQPGDVFVSGDGEPIENFGQLSEIVGANEGKAVHFLVDRNGQQVELTATPHMDKEMGRPIIGVGLTVPHRSTGSFVENLQWGAMYTYNSIYSLLSLPAKIIRGTLPAEQSRLVGLKGIYDIMEYSVQQGIEASQAASPSQPFDWYIPMLEIVAALSISLGVFNLFPFPALDGGRIIFVLPEIITHRRVPAQFENLVHGLGMAVLLLFMLYVNVMDFVNPINMP